MRVKVLNAVIGLVFTLLAMSFTNNLWTIIGLFITFTVTTSFIDQLGKSFPLLELIATITGLQIIVGPFFAYNLPSGNKYMMYVSEVEYMEIVVPIIFSFFLGLTLIKPKINLLKIEEKLQAFNRRNPLIAKQLIFIGIAADLVSGFAPSALAFIFFLAYNLLYVGIILYFFDKKQAKRILVLLFGLIYILTKSLEHGLFHDLIIWAIFLFSILTIKLKPNLLQKLSVLFLGFIFIFSIQTIKSNLRTQLGGSTIDRATLFTNLLVESVYNFSAYWDEDTLNNLNVRLNQGWIVSAVINYVPNQTPFAKGATIEAAITNSILPRFLNPNKGTASGRDNFQRYTGIKLGRNTSMGVSLVGEAYLNFGSMAWLLMLLWGAFIAWIFRFMLHAGFYTNPLLFIFIPIVFLQVIKAETEFNTVLNHLTKASIFIYLLYRFYIKKYNSPINVGGTQLLNDAEYSIIKP